MTRSCIHTVLLLGILTSTAWTNETQSPAWANLDVQLYGYIKADATWSDSRTTPGNYAAWIDSETGGSGSSVAGQDDDEFNLTARETRFGVKLTAPVTNGIAASGRIEFDFFNEDSEPMYSQADNKGLLLLRHAYVQIDHADNGWSLLAGQTSDVVSPLNPTTLNYTVLWWAGNIGYRRAQMRLTKTMELDNNGRLQIQGAIARTMDSAGAGIASESGADAGFPTLQGRVAVTAPWWGNSPATLGISGHWGQEEHDYLVGTTRHEADVDTWSGCLDATLPMWDGLNILGEIYTGANLSAYLGGIGYGVSGTGTSQVQAVRNSGGWIAASLGPWDQWHVNAGYGRSENVSRDLAGGQRETNSSIFTNAIYDFNQHASVGMEVSRWTTEYMGAGFADGKAWRGQLSVILRN